MESRKGGELGQQQQKIEPTTLLQESFNFSLDSTHVYLTLYRRHRRIQDYLPKSKSPSSSPILNVR